MKSRVPTETIGRIDRDYFAGNQRRLFDLLEFRRAMPARRVSRAGSPPRILLGAVPVSGRLPRPLPLVSILGIIWLWRGTGDVERIAAHAQATFWYVLPSVPILWPSRRRCAGRMVKSTELG